MGQTDDIERVIARWAERLRDEIAGAEAILLTGSAARGQLGPWSDLDFRVLTRVPDEWRYLTWVDDAGVADGGRLCHISVGVKHIDGWLARFAEPVTWSFGLPCREATRLLWCRDPARRPALDVPFHERPPDIVELEDLIEGYRKVRNAHVAGDAIAMRLASWDMATRCPMALRPINTPVCPGTRREALAASAAFAVAPPGYRDDLFAALGLADRQSSPMALLAITRRLALGILDLMLAHIDAYAGELGPDLLPALRTGQLHALVREPDGPLP